MKEGKEEKGVGVLSSPSPLPSLSLLYLSLSLPFSPLPLYLFNFSLSPIPSLPSHPLFWSALFPEAPSSPSPISAQLQKRATMQANDLDIVNLSQV